MNITVQLAQEILTLSLQSQSLSDIAERTYQFKNEEMSEMIDTINLQIDQKVKELNNFRNVR